MDELIHRAEAAALLDAVRTGDGRAPDGPPELAEMATVLVERDPDTGTLVGLAWRPTAADPAELYVHPGWRGRGIGRRLAGLLIGAGSGLEPGQAPGIWAHGTMPTAVHLAAALGLEPRRELVQMRAALPADPAALPADPAALPADAAALPVGVVIRTFVPGLDDAEFLRVNAAAFAWHPEQGRFSQRELDAHRAEPWFDPEGFFLAVPQDDAAPGGRIHGFHWTKIHPAEPPAEPEPLGEIYVLGVDPDSPIRRLGGPLTRAGLAHLSQQGLRTALLYVESDNDRAIGLYRRFGFEIHATDTVFS